MREACRVQTERGRRSTLHHTVSSLGESSYQGGKRIALLENEIAIRGDRIADNALGAKLHVYVLIRDVPEWRVGIKEQWDGTDIDEHFERSNVPRGIRFSVLYLEVFQRPEGQFEAPA